MAKEARAGRLIWAGAIANGATLFALLGLIGNVEDPDAALRFLREPMTIYVVGVIFGGCSGYFFAQLADLELQIATDVVIMEAVQAVVRSEDVQELHQAGLAVAGAAGVAYGEIPSSPAEARAKLAKASDALADVARVRGKQKRRLAKAMNVMGYLSLASLFLGTALITWQVERGHRLQPEQAKPAPAEQTKPGSPPTSPSGPAAKSLPPSPPPGTPAPPPRMSAPQGEASPPAADRKDDRG